MVPEVPVDSEKKWAPSIPGVAGFDSEPGQKLHKAGLLL